MKILGAHTAMTSVFAAGALVLPAVAMTPAEAATKATKIASAKKSSSMVLRIGARGARVQEMQRRLKKLGYLHGRIDGVFGSKTASALRLFQRAQGLRADAVVGGRTWKAFARPKKISRKQMNRLRRRAQKVKSYGKGRRGHLMGVLASVKPKGLPLRLAAAVVTVESNWRVNARGSSGERGLMQLMPATARNFGARGNLFNPRENMRVGTKYLHYCYRRAKGNVAATIGCYNRGPGLMWKWSGNPITRRYVSKVHRIMGRRG